MANIGYNEQPKEDDFKFENSFSMPDNYKDIAKQSYEASANPLMESFSQQNKDIENQLASRGITFGGTGNSLRSQQYKSQQSQLGNISKSIGSQIGMSALDKAFQSAEAAKTRQFTSGESALDRSQQTSERLGSEKFGSGESALNRAFTTGERIGGEQFQAGQNQREMSWKTGERLGAEKFGAGESALNRAFTTGERLGAEKFGAGESALDRSQQTKERLGAEKFQASESLSARTLSEDLNQANIDARTAQTKLEFALTNGVDPDTNEPISTAQIQNLRDEADRTFRAMESQKQLDSNKLLNEASNKLQMDISTLNINQQNNVLNTQRNWKNDDEKLLAVLNGSIDKNSQEGKAAIAKVYGKDTDINTNDELATIKEASKMGLTPTQLGEMRRTMGEAQMKTIMDNVSSFISNPSADKLAGVADGLLSTGDPKMVSGGLGLYVSSGIMSNDDANKIRVAMGMNALETQENMTNFMDDPIFNVDEKNKTFAPLDAPIANANTSIDPKDVTPSDAIMYGGHLHGSYKDKEGNVYVYDRPRDKSGNPIKGSNGYALPAVLVKVGDRNAKF